MAIKMNTFTSILNGDNAIPLVSTNGVGIGLIALGGNVLAWNISWSGLDNTDVISVVFVDTNSQIQIDIGANSNQNIPYFSPLIGQSDLLLGSNQIAQILANQWSIIVSTSDFPDGEIAGRVIVDNKRIPPCPPCPPKHNNIRRKRHMMRKSKGTWSNGNGIHDKRKIIVSTRPMRNSMRNRQSNVSSQIRLNAMSATRNGMNRSAMNGSRMQNNMRLNQKFLKKQLGIDLRQRNGHHDDDNCSQCGDQHSTRSDD